MRKGVKPPGWASRMGLQDEPPGWASGVASGVASGISSLN